jgi:hypothetical protein
MSNLQDASRAGLVKQPFSVHIDSPVDEQKHMLQSCFHVVPGTQAAVQEDLSVMIILIPKYTTF